MSFIQKIYYNNKPLILSSEHLTGPRYEGYEILLGANAKNFDDALKMLDKQSCKGIIIVEPCRELLEKELLWAFYPLHSGGGVVLNENGDVLMIYRRGRWDLPKGKLDEGEGIEQCAIREVIEETGLKTVVIKSKICNTLHIYPMSGKMILKYTAWYMMQGTASDSLLPQAEENIEKAMWVKPSEIPHLLENSFETIGEVLMEAKIL